MSSPRASEARPEGIQSAPQSAEKFDRLKGILRTMFQLDRGDLDFGLYRIMNLKAREITDFLDNDLLPQVRTALASNATDRLGELEKELAQAREQARGLRVDPETTPRVKELEQQMAEAKADTAAETEVYNHLANFFARYYDEGDFMSLRRYSGGGQSSYLIPYDGEEVKLHWANADQYYIKSTENYASYVFTVGGSAEKRRVRFEIAKADNEKDNVKEANDKQRRFVLADGENAKTIESDKDELVVRFEHRPLTAGEKNTYPGSSKQQDRINEASRKRVLEALEPDWLALLATRAPTEGNPGPHRAGQAPCYLHSQEQLRLLHSQGLGRIFAPRTGFVPEKRRAERRRPGSRRRSPATSGAGSHAGNPPCRRQDHHLSGPD